MDPEICVVVPTIREYECVRAYVENARRHGFDTDRLEFVLVTEDFCDREAMEAMLDDLGVEGEVFDGDRRESFLLVLDAGTMTERARAPLPHRLPYGFHGQFYAADDPVRSMA